MKYNGLIFDFDYTLGDSTEGIFASVNYALERLGHPPAEREAVRKTIGLHLEETYRVLAADADHPGMEAEFAAYFREKADQVMVANTSFFPGVLQLLQRWKEQRIRLAVVTTKYRYRIEVILEKYHVAGIFDVIVGGEDVILPKPDPEGLLKVQDFWHMKKKEILYVGDSLVDARTAHAAGIDFAGVTTGTTTKEALERYPNVGIFDSLAEISEQIKRNIIVL